MEGKKNHRENHQTCILSILATNMTTLCNGFSSLAHIASTYPLPQILLLQCELAGWVKLNGGLRGEPLHHINSVRSLSQRSSVQAKSPTYGGSHGC